MYHLGRSSAGTPTALTQGMDNILQPPTRKLISSLYHMNLIGGGGVSLMKTALIRENLIPFFIGRFYPSLWLLIKPSSYHITISPSTSLLSTK